MEEGSIIIPHGEILLADGQTKKADKMVPKHAWAKSSDGEILSYCRVEGVACMVNCFYFQRLLKFYFQ